MYRNCSRGLKLLSSKLCAAVVQHQILFGSNLWIFGLPLAKLAPGRSPWVLGRCGAAPGGGALQHVLFFFFFPLSVVFLFTSACSWGKQRSLQLSALFQQLLETFRRSTGSGERLPLWPGVSWQLLQLQASLVGQVRKFRAILKYRGAHLRRPTCVGFLSLPNALRCFEAGA